MYLTYFKKPYEEFNLITLVSEKAYINVKLNKIFTKFKKYAFLPAEYADLLNAYAQYPNYFINILNHHELSIQFYKNKLNANIKNRYELFYREIWNNFTKIRISVVCEQQDTGFLYFVVKNFTFNHVFNTLYSCNLQEAFVTFMEYN